MCIRLLNRPLQGHPDTILRLDQHSVAILQIVLTGWRLDVLIMLNDSSGRVRDLDHRELLPYATPRTGAKGCILRSEFAVVP